MRILIGVVVALMMLTFACSKNVDLVEQDELPVEEFEDDNQVDIESMVDEKPVVVEPDVEDIGELEDLDSIDIDLDFSELDSLEDDLDFEI